MKIALVAVAVGVVILVAVAIYLKFRSGERRAPDNATQLIVLLISKPDALTESSVRQALGRAFKSDFSTNTDERFVLPVIEGYQYMVKNVDTLFILHNRVVPYFEDSEAIAAAIKGDDTLADNVSAHGAWRSLDLLGGERSAAANYDMIGAALAELAPPDAIGIFVVEKGVLIRFDEETKSQLRGPDTLKKLGF